MAKEVIEVDKIALEVALERIVELEMLEAHGEQKLTGVSLRNFISRLPVYYHTLKNDLSK
jgi:hypothetical protein